MGFAFQLVSLTPCGIEDWFSDLSLVITFRVVVLKGLVFLKCRILGQLLYTHHLVLTVVR